MENHIPTDVDFIAGAAIGAFKGPVLDKIAALRSGDVSSVLDADPREMISASRALAVVGDWRPLLAFDDALPNGANTQLQMELGVSLVMADELSRAIARLQSASAGEPTAFNSLARVLARQGDIVGAIEAAERGVAAMPNDFITRNTLTHLQSLQSKGVARMDPDTFPARANLAVRAARQLVSGWDLLKLAVGEATLAAASLGLMERGIALDPSIETDELRASMAEIRARMK